ncbi:putative reverse transcriptase domain-containing protein [Tanacetum coccineum]
MARFMTITRSGMTPEAIEELISRRVELALAAQEGNRNGNHGKNNGDGNQNGGNEGARRNAQVARTIGIDEELTLLCPRMVPEENEKIERMANGLMNQKVHVYAARSAEQKRKFDDNPRGNRTAVATQAPRAPVANQRVMTSFGCGGQGHYKSDCPKLKNQNCGNKAANNDAPDRSFVSTMFSALIDIPPAMLDVSYTVELANGQITESDTIIRSCTLNLLDHPFSTDLMPVELGSFDVIIGMDWLSKYHAVIVCDKKIIRIPYENELLTIQGEESSEGSNSRLSIISCTKTQKYIQRGCHVFLAHISVRKTEDKSEENRLKDVPIV